jgi:hypothetical protein
VMKPDSQLEGFFRFFRDGYRILELSCLKNKGGRFIELCDYHSGSQQGNLRILEGKGGFGWFRFDRELRWFFLGEKLPDSDDRKEAVYSKTRNHRNYLPKRYHFERKSRVLDLAQSKILPGIKPSVTHTNGDNKPRVPRVEMSLDEPRPTRLFDFVWKPRNKTLRITVNEGSKREAKWVGLSTPLGPITKTYRAKSSNIEEVLDAQQSSICLEEMAQLQIQAEAQVEAQVEIKPTSIQASPLKDPTPASLTTASVVLLSREASRDHALKMVDYLPQGTPELILPEPFGSTATQELDFQEPLLVSDMEESELQLSFLETSTSKEFASPLSCIPLNMLAPAVTPPILQSCEAEALVNPSKWVSQQMNYFRKQVGVSISGHEPECMALLTRIDKDRQLLKRTTTSRKSTQKGLRELRNLSSSVNYEGKQVRCC